MKKNNRIKKKMNKKTQLLQNKPKFAKFHNNTEKITKLRKNDMIKFTSNGNKIRKVTYK